MQSGPATGAQAGAAQVGAAQAGGTQAGGTAESHYRCPDELSVSPLGLRRVLIVGSCLTVGWPNVIRTLDPTCQCDFLLINNAAQLPQAMPAPADEYDFQMLQIPLRVLLPERAYFRLAFDDVAGYQALFDDAVVRLRRFLAEGMRWNVEHGLLCFVFNFLPPQQNALGRLLPRYDLRNFVFFVEELNRALAREMAAYTNAHVFDFDQVVCSFGRKYLQDDAVYHTGHGSILSNFDFDKDQDRLEPVARMNATYPMRVQAFLAAGWAELLACYRTIRQIDMVKLVIVDVDDTIWRGVAAEAGSPNAVEGWPLGFIEALLCLKRRGVLLAIVSKNDAATVERLWPGIVGRHIALEDFAIRRIDWAPKADNVERVLAEANLLARNTVFIDDNPVEREAVRRAFPAIRSFGPNPYVWRRLLLWAPETQVVRISDESARRTEMVQAQVQRQNERTQLSREAFLGSLGLKVQMQAVTSVEDAAFARMLELLNKTNQFNTTGERRGLRACAAAMRDGVTFVVFRAEDRFTEYGLVGVVLLRKADIVQMVMSCRVVGLDVELAVMASLLGGLRAAGHAVSRAALVETDSNLLCRDLFARCGFIKDEAGDAELGWVADLAQEMACPEHVAVTSGLNQEQLAA